MSKKIQIQSIKIKIGAKELELTLDEARELKGELDSILRQDDLVIQKLIKEFADKPPKETYIPWPTIPIYPTPPPSSPWVNPGIPYKPVEIWCSVSEN